MKGSDYPEVIKYTVYIPICNIFNSLLLSKGIVFQNKQRQCWSKKTIFNGFHPSHTSGLRKRRNTLSENIKTQKEIAP